MVHRPIVGIGSNSQRKRGQYTISTVGTDCVLFVDETGAAALEPGFHVPPEPSTQGAPYPQSPVYGQPQPQPQPSSFPAPAYPAPPFTYPTVFSQYPEAAFADSYPAFPLYNGIPPGTATFVPPYPRMFYNDPFGNVYIAPMGYPIPVPQPPPAPLPTPQPGVYFTPAGASPMRFPTPHPHGNIPIFPPPVPQPPSYQGSTPVQSPQPQQQYQYFNGDYFGQNRQQWTPSAPQPPPSQVPQSASRAATPTPQAAPQWMPQPPPQPPPGPTSRPDLPRAPPSAFPPQVPLPSYTQIPVTYPKQYMQSPPQTPPQMANGSSSQPPSPVTHLPERTYQWQQTPQNAPIPNPIPKQQKPRRPSLTRLRRRSTTSDIRMVMHQQDMNDQNSDRSGEQPKWRFKWGKFF